jgi:hypothetical protein
MRTNEKVTTLHEWDDANVKARYYIGGDKLVDVTDQTPLPVGWLHSKVRIDLLEFTETFESLDKTMDVKAARLYVNDEFIGDLFDVAQEEAEFGLLIKCNIMVGYD